MVPKLEGTVSARTPFLVVTLSDEEGWPYCARLKRLNASARKITLLRWVSWKFFSTPESSCHNAGPVAIFRPALPQLPAAGSENAAGLIQCEMLRLPRYRGTPGTRLGRWSTLLPSGSSVLLRLRVTLTGIPARAPSSVFRDHPPTKRSVEVPPLK